MRHRVYGRHLGRNKNQRTALFKSLVQALILHETIETTEAKAKSIKGLVDKIITQAKSPDTRRMVKSFLVAKNIQDRLFDDILPRLGSRNSGFTSSVRMGRRLGDGAMVVRMSLLLEEDKKGKQDGVKTGAKVEVEDDVIVGEVVEEKVAAKKVAKKPVKKGKE